MQQHPFLFKAYGSFLPLPCRRRRSITVCHATPAAVSNREKSSHRRNAPRRRRSTRLNAQQIYVDSSPPSHCVGLRLQLVCEPSSPTSVVGLHPLSIRWSPFCYRYHWNAAHFNTDTVYSTTTHTPILSCTTRDETSFGEYAWCKNSGDRC